MTKSTSSPKTSSSSEPSSSSSKPNSPTPATDNTKEPGALAEIIPRLRALIDRVQAGDGAAVAELRELVHYDTTAADTVASMVPSVINMWIRRRARSNQVAQIGLAQLVRTLREDIAGENPSSLELLMVDRLLITWLALDSAEIEYLEGTAADHSRPQAKHWLDRVNGAQVRFMAAARGYALARQLNSPDVISRFPPPRQGLTDRK
jgi:hypothetical protein